MDSQDIRTLKILEEIDSDRMPSQRDLARKLNVSLGLVNSFVKRLAQKGYFKITTIPRNRVRYILTPKGVGEKSRLTYEYIRYSFQFYKAARKELQSVFKRLEKEDIRHIVFCGVSDLAEIAFISLQETSIQFVGVVDDDRIGDKFLNFSIMPLNDLTRIAFDKILVTHIDSEMRSFEQLKSLGITRSKILTL